MTSRSALVYSTDHGRMCPGCGQPQSRCECKSRARTAPPGDGRVRVSHETKGRAGKGVTVVRGLPLDADALAVLGKQLRAACGAGGAVKDGVLEIQGDHREKVMAALEKAGFAAKRSGG